MVVAAVTIVAAYFAWPKKGDDQRIVQQFAPLKTDAATPVPARPDGAPASVLTVSGYIVNRARIELSPRFPGIVKWVAVKKGDPVLKDQVVVTLDDAEQRARLLEARGRANATKAALEKAELAFRRAEELRAKKVETQQLEDDARVAVDAARAEIEAAQGALDYAQVQLDWTQIRSPIDGVVLEKLSEPGELVMPQTFGGAHGPSTAVLAVADPTDLQVEIDVNEGDLAKVALWQKCRVSPEAYPDKLYDGYVAEMAPEANRQKGTLQLKVQIQNPDRFLTPELSARVDFLK